MSISAKLDMVDDLHELLELWDPEWGPHYNFDEYLALSNATKYGGKEFERVVDEYLNG